MSNEYDSGDSNNGQLENKPWAMTVFQATWHHTKECFLVGLVMLGIVLLVIYGLNWMGFSESKPAATEAEPSIDTFKIRFVDSEDFSERKNQVFITYDGESTPLSKVRLEIKAILRNGEILEIGQYRGLWLPGEEIGIDVSSDMRVEGLSVRGTADLNDTTRKIEFGGNNVPPSVDVDFEILLTKPELASETNSAWIKYSSDDGPLMDAHFTSTSN